MRLRDSSSGLSIAALMVFEFGMLGGAGCGGCVTSWWLCATCCDVNVTRDLVGDDGEGVGLYRFCRIVQCT